MDIPESVLLDTVVAQCDAIQVLIDGHAIRLTMHSVQVTSACPLCARPSSRIHSHYSRTLADLPWANVPVQIVLRVRRFFCDEAACPRRVFVERLPTLAGPWARRTQRLATVQRELGLVAGGVGGARLSEKLACPAGVDLLIQFVRQTAEAKRPVPRVLGVDDWAIRKGQTYGTILIDHEHGCVVDILKDRTPEIVTEWLQAHPGVEIVTRDRAEGYARGIRDGAPEARQVADRWHLLKNLTETLAKVFQDHDRAIRALPIAPENTEEMTPNRLSAETSVPAISTTPDVAVAPPAEQRRQARAQQIHRMHTAGCTQRDIARQLHCHPKTVSRVLRRQLPLSFRRATRAKKLDRHDDYLLRRWNEGCHNGARLFREIQHQGFTGRYTIVRDYLAHFRSRDGTPQATNAVVGQGLVAVRTRTWPSPRSLAWRVTQKPDRLTPEDQQLIERLAQSIPVLKTVVALAQSFAQMVRERQSNKLDGWLDEVAHSGIKTLINFANGLRADYDAVFAALELSWSNGRTEGFVNRLKCLKRQTYGRAKLDLLRQRLMAV